MDVRGHSGGLEIGWNAKNIKVLNVWGMELVLGLTFKAMELGDIYNVVNIYGPYLNRISFWDNLFNNSLLGDFNFSLGDLLTKYFTRNWVERNWLDIEPCKLTPTWKNNRCGKGRVVKILDHFLFTEMIVDRHHFIRQWVGKGGLLDHYPIFLEFKNGPIKPPNPFKFNKTRLKYDS